MATDLARQQINWRSRIVRSGTIKASQITPHPQNPRRHPQLQREAVAASFNELGQIAPIVINENNGYLVDGEERSWLALDQPGDVELDAIWVDLTEDEHLKALTYFDATTNLAYYDAIKLDELLQEVNSDSPAIQQMLASLAESAGLYLDKEVPADPGAQVDRAATLQEKWQVKRGDLWIIGKHRLLCGDSTKAEDVARVMGGEKAVLLASDPPYNVNVDYGDNVDDSLIEADYETFSRSWFDLWSAVSERQIVTPGCNNLARWCRYFNAYHVAPWTKTNSMTNGKVSRFWCWEPVLFFGEGWQRKRPNDVFDYPIGEQSGVANHPCPKPLKMWVDVIEQYSDIGTIVADAFMGSGTSIVACEQTGRYARGLEIEPKYCSVILERLSGMGLEPRLEVISAS